VPNLARLGGTGRVRGDVLAAEAHSRTPPPVAPKIPVARYAAGITVDPVIPTNMAVAVPVDVNESHFFKGVEIVCPECRRSGRLRACGK